MELRFEIPGKIGGKGRPRARVHKLSSGKTFAQIYTPPDTRGAEAMVRQFASEAMKDRALFEGPVLVNVTMWLLIPKSWSKQRQLTATYATGRPDLDNIAKSIADAMNGIVYADDSQIASLHITRNYGTVEKTQVCIQQLSGWQLRKRVAA